MIWKASRTLKVALYGALLLLGLSLPSRASETAYDTVPTCPLISTTTRVSVSNSAATVMFSSSTFGGIRVATIQNLDGVVNLWCNYGICVTSDATKACVGFRVAPYGSLTLPLTPIQDTFARPYFGLPYCINDGSAASNAIISLCR